MHKFTNALGSFEFDKDCKLKGKGKGGESPTDPKILNKILQNFKSRAKDFYDINIKNTKKLISESVTDDQLIIQAVKTVVAFDKTANALCKRLREWYSLYLPEASELIEDNEGFSKAVLRKDKNTLKKELKVGVSMGKDLSKEDVEGMMSLAKNIHLIYTEKEKTHKYIESVMKRLCPNVLEISGAVIGAKLIEKAGSIKRMVNMPASTIQLLGAEEALFRHIKTGARPPKYGILLQHKLVAKAKKSDKGRVAKLLADKISIAVKVDYFKGDFVGDKLKKEIEKRVQAVYNERHNSFKQ